MGVFYLATTKPFSHRYLSDQGTNDWQREFVKARQLSIDHRLNPMMFARHTTLYSRDVYCCDLIQMHQKLTAVSESREMRNIRLHDLAVTAENNQDGCARASANYLW